MVSARIGAACPRTSRRSSPPRSRRLGAGVRRSAGGGSPRRIAATPARSATPATAIPSTSAASAAHSRGTISPSSPWRRAPSATASAPPQGRSSPPSDSSPNTAQRSTRSARHLSAGDEQPARRRQVVAGTRLRQVRGREVDGDATAREVEAGVAHRGVHALARLAYGGVAAADDREAGKTGPQVDLDGDAPRGEAVDGERGEASEHELDGGAAARCAGRWICDESAAAPRRFAHPPFRRRIGAEVVTDCVSRATHRYLACRPCHPRTPRSPGPAIPADPSAPEANGSRSRTSGVWASRSSRATTGRAGARST